MGSQREQIDSSSTEQTHVSSHSEDLDLQPSVFVHDLKASRKGIAIDGGCAGGGQSVHVVRNHVAGLTGHVTTNCCSAGANRLHVGTLACNTIVVGTGRGAEA